MIRQTRNKAADHSDSMWQITRHYLTVRVEAFEELVQIYHTIFWDAARGQITRLNHCHLLKVRFKIVCQFYHTTSEVPA
jgi:hypothetical protein